ncbi:MAG: hypothetical protein K1Y36_00610 [Blastocatellia bacterium]|nr:hypothetical protein [Blastocatellia bacterium]
MDAGVWANIVPDTGENRMANRQPRKTHEEKRLMKKMTPDCGEFGTGEKEISALYAFSLMPSLAFEISSFAICDLRFAI